MPLLKFLRSTIGQKILMGATGIGLFGFVLLHMLGNLQIFLGPNSLNHYGELLRLSPELLWVARLGLLAMVIIHIITAINLTRMNRAARPIGYGEKKLVKATWASRTMMISGLIVLAFIVFHLLHFTLGVVNPAYLDWRDEHTRHDIYRMVVDGFQNPLISIGYIICVGLLCLHLSHGVMSLFRSLGLENSFHAIWQVKAARFFSWTIFLGMAAVPAAVMLKILR
jgi:succinate dehydrogenase / fumarate reductase cytochrome b subunit